MANASEKRKDRKTKYNTRWFIREVATRAGFTIGDVQVILDFMIDVLEEVAEKQEPLYIQNLFRMDVTHIAGYAGWNGIEKKDIWVPPSIRIKLSPGANLNRAVRGEFKIERERAEERVPRKVAEGGVIKNFDI